MGLREHFTFSLNSNMCSGVGSGNVLSPSTAEERPEEVSYEVHEYSRVKFQYTRYIGKIVLRQYYIYRGYM